MKTCLAGWVLKIVLTFQRSRLKGIGVRFLRIMIPGLQFQKIVIAVLNYGPKQGLNSRSIRSWMWTMNNVFAWPSVVIPGWLATWSKSTFGHKKGDTQGLFLGELGGHALGFHWLQRLRLLGFWLWNHGPGHRNAHSPVECCDCDAWVWIWQDFSLTVALRRCSWQLCIVAVIGYVLYCIYSIAVFGYLTLWFFDNISTGSNSYICCSQVLWN